MSDNGLNNCTIECCGKNTGAYAYMFANAHPTAKFQNLACSGANSTLVNNTQINYLLPDTDMVTITVGGDNGNAFAGLVRHCVYFRNTQLCNDAFANANNVLNYAQSNLTLVLNRIYATAKSSQINVLGYVQFWNDTVDSGKCQWEPLSDLRAVSAINKTNMNQLVLKANAISLNTINVWNSVNSKDPNFIRARFIDVDPYFRLHRLCDPEPYLKWRAGFQATPPDDSPACGEGNDVWPKTGVFHPNEVGQGVYLNALSASLGC